MGQGEGNTRDTVIGWLSNMRAGAHQDQSQVVVVALSSLSRSSHPSPTRLPPSSQAHSDRLKVYYVVDKASLGGLFWNGGGGYLTKDMLKAHLPPADQAGSMVFVCGPPGMMNVVSGEGWG